MHPKHQHQPHLQQEILKQLDQQVVQQCVQLYGWLIDAEELIKKLKGEDQLVVRLKSKLEKQEQEQLQAKNRQYQQFKVEKKPYFSVACKEEVEMAVKGQYQENKKKKGEIQINQGEVSDVGCISQRFQSLLKSDPILEDNSYKVIQLLSLNSSITHSTLQMKQKQSQYKQMMKKHYKFTRHNKAEQIFTKIVKDKLLKNLDNVQSQMRQVYEMGGRSSISSSSVGGYGQVEDWVEQERQLKLLNQQEKLREEIQGLEKELEKLEMAQDQENKQKQKQKQEGKQHK